MKILFFSLLLFTSSAFADTSFLESQYNVKINLSSSTKDWRARAPDQAAIASEPEIIESWRAKDTYLEVAFQILNIIDWMQTRVVAQSPELYHENESAWAIGTNPTPGGVDAFMSKTALLHFLITYNLEGTWRSVFQYGSIGGKLNATIGNASAGINISFSLK